MANIFDQFDEPAVRAPPRAAGNIFDQFDMDDAPPAGGPSATFSERFQWFPNRENMDALDSGLRSRAAAMTTGPRLSPQQALATDFANQFSAAQQGTTPITSAHQPNLISTDVFQSDAGEVLFRDPATGQVVPTDQAKHVAMRDPADGRVKIYGRSEETDAGPLESVSRILTTGMAAGAPTTRAAMTAPRAVAPRQELIEAAERIGVDVPRAAASDQMLTQRVGQAVANHPFGSSMRGAAERAIEGLGERATETAAALGRGGSPAEAGGTASAAIKNYIGPVTEARTDKLYNAVDKYVDPNARGTLEATRQVVAKISAKREAARLGPSAAVQDVLPAVQDPAGLTYEGLKTLRTTVGEKLNGRILPADISGAELKQIYGALSEDRKAVALAAGGPRAGQALARADRYYKLVSDRREALAKIVGADGNAPAEQVFDRLVAMAGSKQRADIARLTQARKAMPAEDWGDFVSGLVQRLGRTPEGAFSAERFSTAYGNLSDAGKSLLFRSTGQGDLARHLDDIATISGRFKQLQRFANPSGTAQTATAHSLLGGSFAYFVDPLTALGSAVAPWATAHLLSRPATAASTASWMRSFERLARNPSPASFAAFDRSTRNLANTAQSSGVSINPAELLRALQGPSPARTDEQPE